jgi:hypothetical protein
MWHTRCLIMNHTVHFCDQNETPSWSAVCIRLRVESCVGCFFLFYFQPSRIKVHPRFDRKTFENDVALLLFDEPGFNLTEDVIPICLWNENYDISLIQGKDGIVGILNILFHQSFKWHIFIGHRMGTHGKRYVVRGAARGKNEGGKPHRVLPEKEILLRKELEARKKLLRWRRKYLNQPFISMIAW